MRMSKLLFHAVAANTFVHITEDDRCAVARWVHERSYSRTLPGPLDDDFPASNSSPDRARSAPRIPLPQRPIRCRYGNGNGVTGLASVEWKAKNGIGISSVGPAHLSIFPSVVSLPRRSIFGD